MLATSVKQRGWQTGATYAAKGLVCIVGDDEQSHRIMEELEGLYAAGNPDNIVRYMVDEHAKGTLWVRGFEGNHRRTLATGVGIAAEYAGQAPFSRTDFPFLLFSPEMPVAFAQLVAAGDNQNNEAASLMGYTQMLQMYSTLWWNLRNGAVQPKERQFLEYINKAGLFATEKKRGSVSHYTAMIRLFQVGKGEAAQGRKC
jgi:hypothetical protein